VVAHPGAQDGSRRLRPLNRPRPLRVEVGEEGRPAAAYLSNGRFSIEEVLEVWRIDDEWWRERPVSRLYYRLLLEDGRTVTVYRDEASGRWWKQGY
jgi:protein ImuB